MTAKTLLNVALSVLVNGSGQVTFISARAVQADATDATLTRVVNVIPTLSEQDTINLQTIATAVIAQVPE